MDLLQIMGALGTYLIADAFFGGPVTTLARAVAERLRRPKNNGKSKGLTIEERKVLLEEKRMDMEERRLKLIEKAVDTGDTKALALLAKKDGVPIGDIDPPQA